jgi:hypothetical protein
MCGCFDTDSHTQRCGSPLLSSFSVTCLPFYIISSHPSPRYVLLSPQDRGGGGGKAPESKGHERNQLKKAKHSEANMQRNDDDNDDDDDGRRITERAPPVRLRAGAGEGCTCTLNCATCIEVAETLSDMSP